MDYELRRLILADARTRTSAVNTNLLLILFAIGTTWGTVKPRYSIPRQNQHDYQNRDCKNDKSPFGSPTKHTDMIAERAEFE